jgi:uncharacterized protein (DUF305 family)
MPGYADRKADHLHRLRRISGHDGGLSAGRTPTMNSGMRRTITTALAAAVFAVPAAWATTAAAAPLPTSTPSTMTSPQPSPSDDQTMLTTAAAAHMPTSTPGTAASTQPSPSDDQAMLALASRYATALRGLHGPVFEQTFLGNMISHHAAAVAMAQLELARGTHPQAKTLARQIITSQNSEITEMTTWLQQWYGLTPQQAQQKAPASIQALTNQIHTGMQSMQRRLAAVPAGPGFDQAFLTAMIPHHEMAIVIAGAVPGHATHPQVTTLARQISTSQTGQVQQMQAWLRAWYGTIT